MTIDGLTSDDCARAELNAATADWKQAEERHERAKAARDRAIIAAYQTHGLGAAEIAGAFGITDRWVWRLAAKRQP
jgi:hypothetical protein